jgi:hypothetical protein
MTSAVIWRRREVMDFSSFGGGTSIHPGDIWIAADSRISTQTNSGSRLVPTDAALKILPINLKLFQGYEDGPAAFPSMRGRSPSPMPGASFSAR